MKKYVLSFPILLISSIASTLSAQETTLSQIWQSDTTLRTPESVLFESKENVLYVSCINGNPTTDNKSSFISKVSPEGKVINLKFTDGLNSTKGMGILGNKLYVTEMTNLVEIDLSNGKILNRYPVEGAGFLNDITVDSKKGTIYFSDSGVGKLLAFENGKISLISDDVLLKGINGLLMEDGKLLIGNGDGALLSMNTSSKKLTTIASGMGGIDGIVSLGNKKYIVSEWGGKIWHINAGSSKLLIDSSREKINTADMDYDPKTKTLFVPNFYNNTVRAYLVR